MGNDAAEHGLRRGLGTSEAQLEALHGVHDVSRWQLIAIGRTALAALIATMGTMGTMTPT